MFNQLIFTLIGLAGSAPTAMVAAQPPVECVYTATSEADRQLISALAARGGGQRSPQETAAIDRLNRNSQGCKQANRWSENKSRAAFEYARALFLQDYGKALLTSRRIPLGPVERTYGRMTPAMRSSLLAGSFDPAISAILIDEAKKAGLKPGQVGREEGRIMGNILAGKAAADRARTAFDTL